MEHADFRTIMQSVREQLVLDQTNNVAIAINENRVFPGAVMSVKNFSAMTAN
jgi:hypothetical protein